LPVQRLSYGEGGFNIVIKGNLKVNNTNISNLLEAFLKYQSRSPIVEIIGGHLDEDLLSAFIEGKLNQRETAPIIRHLVGCQMCRHVTAQLVQLEFELSENTVIPHSKQAETGRFAEFWNFLTARVFNLNDNSAVFAHHDTTETPDSAAPADENGNSETH
jgi:hypothetical protein